MTAKAINSFILDMNAQCCAGSPNGHCSFKSDRNELILHSMWQVIHDIFVLTGAVKALGELREWVMWLFYYNILYKQLFAIELSLISCIHNSE